MDKSLEVVVIGAGIAGLSAAAALSRAGRQTAVFEQHHQPGGYWSSFVRRGILFDITPHWTTAPERVNAFLAEHGAGPLEFERHAHVGRYLGPEPGWDVRVSTDRRRFEDSVLASFPGVRRETLESLGATCREVFRAVDSIPPRNLELAGPLASLAAVPGLLWKLRRVLRYTRQPAEAFLQSYFPGEGLRGLRTLLALTAPIPDIAAIGVIAMMGIALEGRAFSPVGGAQTVGDAFARAALSSGAQIHYKRLVKRILVENGRAAGGLPALRPLRDPLPGHGPGPGRLRLRGHGHLRGLLGGSIADPAAQRGLQVVAPASFDYEERWRSGPGLERARRLLANVESRLPGLRRHIVHLDAATPLTMHRYTLNDRGAPVGWGYKNPLRWKQRVAFLPGLYQAGHWVGPSGVVNAAVSGRQAAELVLQDLA